MNFVFGALLITILLLPGIFFRIGYLKAPYSKFFRASFTEEILISLVITLIFQMLGYFVVDSFIKNVDEKTFYLLFINSDKAVGHQLNILSVFLFFIYNVIMNVIAFLLGHEARKYVIKRHLDLKYSLLKIRNDWENYFEGYILDRPDTPGSSAEVSAKWLDVLVKVDNNVYIYSGFLEDYAVTKDEKLERVYLTGVRRRKLDQKPENAVDQTEAQGQDVVVNYNTPESAASEAVENAIDDVYYYMPGNYFMIPGNQIININITYYYAQVEEDVETNE